MSNSAAIFIQSIALDPESGQLTITPGLPAGSDYEFIWRDASGIRWDSAERALIADQPNRWQPEALFRQMLQAVHREYGDRLEFSPETRWSVADGALVERLKSVAQESWRPSASSSVCSNCHGESQELWAIGPPYPQWQEAGAGKFVILQRCPTCAQLWLESCYEPFASFRYAVKWPGDLHLFEAMRDRDQSRALCQWHEAQVRLLGNDASDATLALIKAHCDRSRGYVDLMPSQAPNPIVLG